MSKSNEKWLLFKNFMHNELEISREDIREWIKEAVKEEARKMVGNEFGKFSVEEIIHKILLRHDLFTGGYFKKEVIEEAGKQIVAKLDIRPKETKE